MKKRYVIGDVHGCFFTLSTLLEKLPKDIEIIFVGDLCDKGKFSKEVIDLVIKNGYKCVKGNHEHLMEIYMRDAVFQNRHSPWSSDKRYGGMATLESYADDNETMLHHLEWVESLPMYLQIENYFISHGFALPFYEQRDNSDYYNDFLLHRYEKGMALDRESLAKYGVINIFGHCVFDEVVEDGLFYGIDTGCSYGQKLTAIELGSMKILQEPMDKRDSSYSIKELKLSHLSFLKEASLISIMKEIDQKFQHYDLVSTEVAEHIVQRFQKEGRREVEKMLEKRQLFMKQAKKILLEE